VGWSTGLSNTFCIQVDEFGIQVDDMIDDAQRFPKGSIVYNAYFGPNSNSAAHYLAEVAEFAVSRR